MTPAPHAVACDRAATSCAPAPEVLVLHLVGSFRSRYAIETTAFGRGLEATLAAGWAVRPLGELVRKAEEVGRADPRSLALTFDDAYACVASEALPVAAALGVAGTVFVNTEAVGGTNAWNRRAGLRLRHCDWSDLDALRRAGWEIGSHGHGHFNLLALSDDEIREDIARSIKSLQAHLGCVPSSFAYPYGKFDDRVRAVVRERFAVAVATERGGECLSHDRHTLGRFWPEIAPDPIRTFFGPVTA